MGSLLGVDDLVERVVKALKRNGVYRNTDIIFTSDNGWILGEHRLHRPDAARTARATGVKFFPYEGSSRVPLMAAGPDFPAGGRCGAPVVNADLAPTIARHRRRARRRCPRTASRCWPRRASRRGSNGRGVLLETFANPRGAPPYTSIRTQRYRYERVDDTGDEGLYDLKLDPWELQSRHDDPRYARIKAILAGGLGEAAATARGRAAG